MVLKIKASIKGSEKVLSLAYLSRTKKLFSICEPNFSESKKIGSHFSNAHKLPQR
jgi:hypothetical protein